MLLSLFYRLSYLFSFIILLLNSLIFIRCLAPENIFFDPSNNSEKFCEESVIFHKHPEMQARASACCNNEDFCNERLVDNLRLPSPG